MKKIFILISFIPIFFVSCFEYEGRTSRALIKALVHFPSDVAKVHVAVYDGAILADRLVLTETAIPSTGLNITVPPGENRMFLIVGEDYAGLAKYYGVSGPYHVSDENTVNVVANMLPIATNFGLVHIVGAGPSPIRWNNLPGVTFYTIKIFDPGGGPYNATYVGPLNSFYYNPGTAIVLNGIGNAYYEVFNLYSVWSNIASLVF
jgi:hypothetical protein